MALECFYIAQNWKHTCDGNHKDLDMSKGCQLNGYDTEKHYNFSYQCLSSEASSE